LWNEEEEECFAKVTLDGYRSEGHAGEVAEGVAGECLGGIPGVSGVIR